MKTFGTIPVAIRRESIPELRTLYQRSAAWIPTPEAVAALEAAAVRRPVAAPGKGVALLALHGIILRRPSFIDEFFGAASLEGFMARFRDAIGDPEIGTIVVSVDSPGGEIDGVPEAAAEIRASRGTKSVVMVADTMACSAAYWLLAQGSEVIGSPTSILGNIGVYVIHDDITGLLESEGVKRDVIASSELKAAFADGGAFTEEARAQVQSIVDEHAGTFVSDVAKGRGVTATVVRKDFGGGGILSSSTSLEAKMIDRIDTLAGALRKAVGTRPSTQPAAAVLAPGWDELASLGDGSETPTDDETGTTETEVLAAAAALEMARARARAHQHTR